MNNKWKKIPASARFILSGQLTVPDDLPAGCTYKCDGSICLKDSIPLDCEFGIMISHNCFDDRILEPSHYRLKSDLLQIYDTEVFDV